MTPRLAATLVALAVSTPILVEAQTFDDAPWEPDLRASPPATASDAPDYRPVSGALLAFINLYRSRIGPRSIRRCPYVVSCSTFARAAIERYGLLGLPLALDRYLFRDNLGAFEKYRLVRMPDGSLRLDDTLR